MDVLHHDLETVEAMRLRRLNFIQESLHEVLVDNTIRRGKEGQDMQDGVMLLSFRQLFQSRSP
jgi:hypothetical protein